MTARFAGVKTRSDILILWYGSGMYEKPAHMYDSKTHTVWNGGEQNKNRAQFHK